MVCHRNDSAVQLPWSRHGGPQSEKRRRDGAHPGIDPARRHPQEYAHDGAGYRTEPIDHCWSPGMCRERCGHPARPVRPARQDRVDFEADRAARGRTVLYVPRPSVSAFIWSTRLFGRMSVQWSSM